VLFNLPSELKIFNLGLIIEIIVSSSFNFDVFFLLNALKIDRFFCSVSNVGK
jgi:hypothetical protein